MRTHKVLLIIVLLITFSAFVSVDIVPDKPEDVSPLLIGEKIPAINLKTARGESFDLNESIKSKQAILIFYRGGWCPFCVKHLKEIAQIEKELGTAGWQIIAISPDSPENLKNTVEKQGINFTLLSDADMSLAKNMGIAFKGNYGKMLTEKSGGKNTDQLLPVPAVFFVNRNGSIAFEYINPDFKSRMNTNLLKSVASNLEY